MNNVFQNNVKPILKKLLPHIEKLFLSFGRVVGLFYIPFFRSQLFFFFPFYHIGGAEKIHLKITHCLKEHRPIIFFTGKSESTALKKQFMQSAKTVEIGYLINPGYSITVFFYFWVGIVSTVVNSNKNSIVFGCNSRFFYKLIPNLKSQICCIDLLHAFGGGMEDLSLRYVERLDKRVVINKRTLNDFKDQYRLNNVSEEMNKRIYLIENCVKIPEKSRRKNNESTLRIVYVGRGSEEKRVNIIGKISCLCHQENMPVEFLLVGDVKDSIDEKYRKHCNFLGEIVDENEISEIYDSSDILLLVSSREGFPLVIMEAMAHGVVTISTDVGGISEHVHNGQNGFLIKNESEDVIVKNIFKLISELVSNRPLMNKTSLEAYKYAKTKFNCEKFCSEYKKLIWDK